MEWFKKHVDTVVILGAFASSIFWINGKFEVVEKDIARIEKEIAIVKTVLIMQNVMPREYAVDDK